jgi:murein DD-endopeptidase MepM/ murein hydrolase activator NlpD
MRLKVKGRWILLLIISTVCLFYMLIHHALTQIVPVTIPSAIVVEQPAWSIDPALSWETIVVKKGDTLSKIFSPLGIHYQTLKKILTVPDAKHYLGQLHPGQMFYLSAEPNTQKTWIKYPVGANRILYIDATQALFESHWATQPLTKKLRYQSSTIKQSFTQAARQAGLTRQQSQQLSDIFSGSINFSRDVHAGDSFDMILEDFYLHGKKVRTGNIVAASFNNHGKNYTALRYTYPRNHSGYYTPTGQGVEPLFLRAPLKYKRISSHFTLHRYDPVLHFVHPHLGIDFAAHYGTPIHSIGDGKIIYRGKKGGYGNAIIIRYNKKYKALYAHMSKFAKKQHTGQAVKKGQVIGYVGSSGWSTGPHLHFSLYVYGIPRDPLKMKLIGGKVVPKNYLADFKKKAATLLDKLKFYEKNKRE